MERISSSSIFLSEDFAIMTALVFSVLFFVIQYYKSNTHVSPPNDLPVEIDDKGRIKVSARGKKFATKVASAIDPQKLSNVIQDLKTHQDLENSEIAITNDNDADADVDVDVDLPIKSKKSKNRKKKKTLASTRSDSSSMDSLLRRSSFSNVTCITSSTDNSSSSLEDEKENANGFIFSSKITSLDQIKPETLASIQKLLLLADAEWDVAGKRGEGTVERLRRDVKNLEDQLASSKSLLSNNLNAYELEVKKSSALALQLKQSEAMASNTIQSMNREINDLNGKMVYLSNANEILQSNLDQLATDRNTFTQNIKDYELKFEQLQEFDNVKSKRMSELETEKVALQKTLESTIHDLYQTLALKESALTSSTEELATSLKERQSLFQETLDLTSQIDSLKKRMLEVTLSLPEKDKMFEENFTLLKQSHQEEIVALNQTIEKMTADEAKLRLISGNFIQKIKSLEDEMSILQAELETVKGENKTLKQQSAVSMEKVLELESLVRNLESEKASCMEDSKMRVVEVEKELSLAMENLDKFKTELEVVGLSFKEMEEERDKLRDQFVNLKKFNVKEVRKVIGGDESFSIPAAAAAATRSENHAGINGNIDDAIMAERYIQLKQVLERATRESVKLKLLIASEDQLKSEGDSLEELQKKLDDVEAERKTSVRKLAEFQAEYSVNPNLELQVLRREVNMYGDLIADLERQVIVNSK